MSSTMCGAGITSRRLHCFAAKRPSRESRQYLPRPVELARRESVVSRFLGGNQEHLVLWSVPRCVLAEQSDPPRRYLHHPQMVARSRLSAFTPPGLEGCPRSPACRRPRRHPVQPGAPKVQPMFRARLPECAYGQSGLQHVLNSIVVKLPRTRIDAEAGEERDGTSGARTVSRSDTATESRGHVKQLTKEEKTCHGSAKRTSGFQKTVHRQHHS